jgi:hypothetical protein
MVVKIHRIMYVAIFINGPAEEYIGTMPIPEPAELIDFVLLGKDQQVTYRRVDLTYFEEMILDEAATTYYIYRYGFHTIKSL